jgi:hypothetical protein
MHNHAVRYLHLDPEAELPALQGLHQFKAIIAIEAEVHEAVMWDVSRWLISSGCLVALTWGKNSEAWREAIDDAFLEAVDYEDVPAERAVIATAHEEDDLDEVFWYAKHRASHPAELHDTLIIHLADTSRRDELEAQYHDA